MDLNLNALIGVTYLVPIAITLRKLYTPSFETPQAMTFAVAKLEPSLKRAALRKGSRGF